MNSRWQLVAVLAMSVLCGCTRKSELSRDGWGESVNGLRLRIWGDKQIFESKEPIRINSCLSNASSAPITFWNSGFWPNTRVDMFDLNGHAVGRAQEGTATLNMFSPGGERDKNYPVHLKAGQIYMVAPVDVRPLFELQPNAVYFVQFTYEERQQEHWRGKVQSGRVRIQTIKR